MILIAEIGQAHEGSVGIAHSYIDALAETGVHAVKFQTHIAEAESSSVEPFRVKFSYEDKTRFGYWQRMEFTFEQWIGLKEHCDEVGLEFISSPFSCAAVDLLERLGVNKYKIGSGEVSNFLMLEKIANTGKQILLSSGMSSFEEIDNTLEFLSKYNNPITLFQCTTAYPTMPSDFGLNIITEFQNRYNLPIGFSDHSGDIYAGLAAATLGAEVLEFHAVFDKRMFGPDSTSSLTMNQIKSLSKGVMAITESLKKPIDKSDNSKFYSLKSIFEKTLAVNKDLHKGQIVRLEDLEAKKPALQGVAASEYRSVVGKKLVKDKLKWDFIDTEDFVL